MLDHPSLAELLPSGVFMVNDDYNDRMVAIDPATGALVWQYGITGTPGTAPGQLNTPDGFDLLLPDGSTPTHLVTGLALCGLAGLAPRQAHPAPAQPCAVRAGADLVTPWVAARPGMG